MFRVIVLLTLFSVCSQTYAQELMTIGKEKVNLDEFLRIYQKNNQSANSFSEKEINEYLDLFTLFKMKLQEAKRLRLDTLPSVQEDYQKYTEQLIQNHFVDKNYIESIWKAQYENMKYDVKLAHIMVKCAPNASPSDTSLAFNKINFLRKQATAENFTKLAIENSEDPSSAPKGGLLGYITAFMTFPEFEQPCFATPPGGLSPVFRTQYGYHFLHVLDKRPARGRIKVAHIYLKKTEKPTEVEKKMQEVFRLISQKKLSFEEAVAKYTEDASTKDSKGELQEFGVSEMVSDFEEQCFALKNPGEISKPFMTEYGWHLVKLIEKKPVKSFENSKEYIQQRMSRDPRVTNLRGVAFQRMKERYQLIENKTSFQKLLAPIHDTFFMVKNWMLRPDKNLANDTMFTFAARPLKVKDFTDYVNQKFKTASSRNKAEALAAMYEAYKESMIWEIAKNQLITSDTQFRQLESEYMNGLLIFEIMDREVWKKAIADTIGTKKLYEEVKNNYWYKDRAALEGIKTSKQELALSIGNSLKNQTAKFVYDDLKKTKDSNEVLYYERIVERGDVPEVDQAMDTKQQTLSFQEDSKSFIAAKLTKILSPSIKPYSEIKGRIQNLYQSKLEKEWAANLKLRYPVKLNADLLKKIIK